jgi:hypothetical protein
VAGRLLGAAASYTGAPSLLGIFPAARAGAREDIDALHARLGARFEPTVRAGRSLSLDEVVRLARGLV